VRSSEGRTLRSGSDERSAPLGRFISTGTSDVEGFGEVKTSIGRFWESAGPSHRCRSVVATLVNVGRAMPVVEKLLFKLLVQLGREKKGSFDAFDEREGEGRG
jgi:hypothetical protein